MSPWERINFYLLSSFSTAYTHLHLNGQQLISLSPAVNVSCQGHLVSSVVLIWICLILKGKQRSFGVWRGLMVVIRHRMSHQQGWTLMSKGKGLMPTKKWLSHSFSLCQLWFLAMLISKHLYMCALKILKVLLCLNRITFSFYFH